MKIWALRDEKGKYKIDKYLETTVFIVINGKFVVEMKNENKIICLLRI